jgi:hypothetical protein
VTDAALLTTLFCIFSPTGEYIMNETVGASKVNAFSNVPTICWMVTPNFAPAMGLALPILHWIVVVDDHAVVPHTSLS